MVYHPSHAAGPLLWSGSPAETPTPRSMMSKASLIFQGDMQGWEWGGGACCGRLAACGCVWVWGSVRMCADIALRTRAQARDPLSTQASAEGRKAWGVLGSAAAIGVASSDRLFFCSPAERH